MHKQDQTTSASCPATTFKLRKLYKIFTIILSATIVVLLACSLAMYSYNNLSLKDDHIFNRDINNAIENARMWVDIHRNEILKKKNIALIRMLQDIDKIYPDPLYSGIVKTLMATPFRPDCWKRLLDPN